jgi:hypothetical protein
VKEVRESREKHYIITGMHYKSEESEKKETKEKGGKDYPGILKMSLNSIPGGSAIGSMTKPSVPNA